MNYMLLVNVLEYLDRENLEKLSIVSRLFEKIVRIEFPRHPFRVFNKLYIETGTNGNIDLGMQNERITLQITPYAVEFKRYSTIRNGARYFSVRAMQPFLSKSVRFGRTIIEVNSTLFSQQSITAMENFAHLWTGRILKIEHGYDIITPASPNHHRYAPDNAITPNCELLFNAPGIITPCRELDICRINAPINYPALYALQMIKISEVHGFSADNLLNFVEGLSKYNSTTQLVCFSRVNFQRTHIGIIREAFSKSKVSHAWKLFLVDRQAGNSKLIEFRDENLLTKDVLELRLSDSQMKQDLCTSLGIFFCHNLWILERKPL
ncbi:hypothetical protein Ddc_18181 [Ditylenchus destructor]|nr:hypothetical protein Ddc_18181 [Ditylenchus destructor]